MALPIRALELKIPPPAVATIIALAMWGASRVDPTIRFPFVVRATAAVVLAVAGACISLAGVASFRRARTTVNPMKPDSTSSLVRTGIYGVTRNPMYLGLLVVLLGWAAFLSSPLALVIAMTFVLYMNLFQIAPEERTLSAMFGDQFTAYAANVRRWL